MPSQSLSHYFITSTDGEPESYTTAFVEAVSHGVVSGVHIPDSSAPVPDEVLSRLQPEEKTLADEMRAYRQVSWTGGRLALHTAVRSLGERGDAVPAGPRGEPVLPRGIAGSVSHKRKLAVAIAARSSHGTIGIDLEDLGPPRKGIAERVLLPEELAAVAELPEDRQWISIVLRFSIKEAIYKALHPHVRRFVDFSEACVTPDVDGTAQVEMRLARDEGPFKVEAFYYWLPGQVLSTVRIRTKRRGRRGSEPPPAEAPADDS